MFVRAIFVLQRFLGYGAVFFYLVSENQHRPWWQWLLGIVVWSFGTVEYLKRPDDRVPIMRLGILLEVLTIALWTLSVENSLVIILLVSPVARAGVHLGWRDSVLLILFSMASVFGAWRIGSTALWITWLEFAVIAAMFGYSLVVGELLRQRDKLRRTVQLTAFEREQRVKDEERLRMAGELHDTLGQHWTAVIRALDVAEQVTGEQQLIFIRKARFTASEGLSAMRQATHSWNTGGQEPQEWVQYAKDSLSRLRETVGIDIQLRFSEIDWTKFASGTATAQLLARTLIEGATNAIRHGEAHRILISVDSNAQGLCAVIRDDGIGLQIPGIKNIDAGMGITILRNSAIEMGGSLRLDSVLGNDTALILKVPYTG